MKTYELKNHYLKAVFNQDGTITQLINLNAKNKSFDIIEVPAESSFRLVFVSDYDKCLENIVWSKNQTITAEQTEDKLIFTVENVVFDNGRAFDNKAEIKIKLVVQLIGEDLIFNGEVTNYEDVLITDFEYPYLGKIRSLGDGNPSLLMPNQNGLKYTNVAARVSYNTSRENGNNRLTETYPAPMSMQWMALTDKSNTLFFEGNDKKFYVSEFSVNGDYNNPGTVTLMLNKTICLKKNQTCILPDLKIKLYEGNWHHGADDYVKWMSEFKPVHHVPQWVRDMTGYFLVINKQQFGYEMWSYDTLPDLYDYAAAHGCDTVGLFGWYDSGHDNKYPDLEVSESLGGKECLEKGIQSIHDKGGHVTLYYQGHLIDPTTDFYKNGGSKVAMKNIWGNDYNEFYSKSHKSDFLRNFSRKNFSIGCPSCPEWRDLMVERGTWIHSFGADGVLYDQIGGITPYLCFDESHPHDERNPSFSMSHGRQKLLDAIQKNTKRLNSEFAFFSEHITDLYANYLDGLHGINSRPGRMGERYDTAVNAGRCEVLNYPELFRYCFPDSVCTVRNPAPYISPRFVNYATVFGFRYEIEIRYQDDKIDLINDKYAEYREYAKKITDLRKKYWYILGRGKFTDDKYIKDVNNAVIAKSFVKDDKLAVVMWNDTDSAQMPELIVHENYKLVEMTNNEPLQPNELCVAIYSLN